ncbi:hypothetical protein [Campylobacter concisus]|uniref:hypothetical protein n=1 Tax=Campylobacter concisus TaxID=199 RepID=UPI00214DA57B|nr:hypothetical protein [Campylobacter concisus]
MLIQYITYYLKILNKNGTITLKFDSGRELEVKEIYSDTGKLINDDIKDSKRAWGKAR